MDIFLLNGFGHNGFDCNDSQNGFGHNDGHNNSNGAPITNGVVRHDVASDGPDVYSHGVVVGWGGGARKQQQQWRWCPCHCGQ